MPEDVQKLVLNIMKGQMTQEQFKSALKQVINKVKKIEADNNKTIEKIRQELSNAVSKIDNKLKEYEKEGKTATQAEINALRATYNKSIEQIQRQAADIRDGVDGKDGEPGEKGEPGKDADEQKIINELEKRLERNDEELLAKVKEMFEEWKTDNPRRLGGGGFSKIHMEQKFIDDETPTGTVNGSNTDFVLTATPNPTGSLKVYVNGQRMRITEDYTLSGKTITFNTAPPTNSIILCDYRK